MSATVAATYIERLIALATVGIGTAVSVLLLFGSFGFELHAGGPISSRSRARSR